ncbi:hypothetical protein KGQ71_01060 [Patescibacteria group bacterium]|nr:hypothetical protein [Patescibacteria group bacterium]
MEFTNMVASGTAASGNILVIAQPATSTTAQNVVITFASGYTVATGAGAITISTSGLPSTYNGASVVAWPSVANGTASGQVVTFSTSGGSALSTSTVYGFWITAGITNPSSPGQYLNTVSVTTGDTTQIATYVLSDNTITITATVPPIFSLTMGGNTDAFTGNLSPTAIVLTTGQTATIATNAAQGWTAWMKSQNQALKSATTGSGNDIPSVSAGSLQTLSSGTPAYALAVSSTHASGTGTITVSTAYSGNGTTQGGALTAGFTQIAKSTGTASADVVTLKELAAISATTGAATDYTDMLTVIAAGNF